ncbi:hypothetical protein VE03_10272 [Pseudogymnoascus sp. 23342-1-I1]|nr:hypothetical protein VE03_10272 [Pseudogymnoascus sp. 23342-1-I1]
MAFTERIILLIHIMGLIVDQNPQGPATQRGLDVAKLEEVTREAMASWFADKEKPKNAGKRGFLAQLFRVLYKEESYRRGKLEANATVCINQSAGNTNFEDNDDEDFDPSPLQKQAANTISPFFPVRPSPLLPSQAITSTTSTSASDSMRDHYPRLPPSSSTTGEYPGTYPFTMYNHLPNHQQQPRQHPPQDLLRHSQGHISQGTYNIYEPHWPTPPKQQSALPTTSSPPSFSLPTTISLPPQQQGAGWVLPSPLLPPPMAQGGLYEDAAGRGSFDRDVMRAFVDGEGAMGYLS